VCVGVHGFWGTEALLCVTKYLERWKFDQRFNKKMCVLLMPLTQTLKAITRIDTSNVTNKAEATCANH